MKGGACMKGGKNLYRILLFFVCLFVLNPSLLLTHPCKAKIKNENKKSMLANTPSVKVSLYKDIKPARVSLY